MNGPTYAPGILNSWVKGLSIAWTLPSNKSKPWQSPENPANIIKLLDFPTSPPMKVTSEKPYSYFLFANLVNNKQSPPKNLG